jgi:hypothetical protein
MSPMHLMTVASLKVILPQERKILVQLLPKFRMAVNDQGVWSKGGCVELSCSERIIIQ